MRPRRGRQSKREQISANNAWSRFYAGASERPDAVERTERDLITPLAPKRERIRRPIARVLASEHQEQATVIDWWDRVHEKYGLPVFALFAVPNGGARDAITGARLKAEGVRRGALDLILARPRIPYHGLYIEMKIGNNKPSTEQNAFIEYLTSEDYKVSVHWNAGSAITAIEDYLR